MHSLILCDEYYLCDVLKHLKSGELTFSLKEIFHVDK